MKIKIRLSITWAIVVSIAGWAGASGMEKPSVMPDAMVSVTISDLHGFIDGVGTTASQVTPMASGMMIKSILGMQLGDPGLAGIAPGKGLAIAALDPTNVFAVLEVSEAKAPTYSAVLSQQGMVSGYTNGVLVIARDSAQLDKGVAMAAAVRQALLGKRSPSLNVVAKPAAMIETNSNTIEGMIGMMPMMMGMGMAQSPGMDPAAMQSVVRILEGEIRVLLSLAKQCDVLELMLEPRDGALRINKTLVPRTGTRLATLINAPAVTTPNPKVQSGMLGEAVIAIDGTLANPGALTDFFCEEINLVLKEMGIESELIAQMNDTMKEWAGIYKGSFSETISFGGDSFINLGYALDIASEAEVVDLFRGMEQDMAPFFELYKTLGMPMRVMFGENVREHNGIKIHQLKLSMSLPAEEMAAASAMNMNFSNLVYDVAVCDDLLLLAMGETRIEALIDRAKDENFKATPLKARSVYPAGAIYYCDVDVAGYLEGLSSILPADPSNQLPQMAAMLKGVDPVTSAAFRGNGMVMWSMNLPGSLLARFGQAAMAGQMQQMNTMQQIPQPPTQVFEAPAAPGTMPSVQEAVPLP